MTVDEVLDLLLHDQTTQIRAEHTRVLNVCKQFNKPLLGYEGGQHISTFGDPITNAPEAEKNAFKVLTSQANAHPRMAAIYRTHFDDWFNNDGGLYCQWNYLSLSGGGFDWGLTTRLGQPLDQAPKLRAVIDYLALPLPSPTPAP